MAKKNVNVSLKNVRNEFKSVTGTVSHCISVVYSEYENLKGTELCRILPKSKKAAMEDASAIYEWGKVGQEKTIKMKNGVRICTIKPSVDMVLRYYVAKANLALRYAEEIAKTEEA